MICPLRIISNTTLTNDCLKKLCAFWCEGEKCCAVKAIVMQLIKLEEK